MSSLNIIRQILLNSFQMDHNTFIISYCILYTVYCYTQYTRFYTLPVNDPSTAPRYKSSRVICCSTTPPLLKALASRYEGNMKAL